MLSVTQLCGFSITRGSNSYSNYFDGVGDYLTTPNNSAFSLDSSDFTIEMWVYPTVTTQITPIERRSTSFLSGDWIIFLIGSTIEVYAYDINGGTPMLTGTGITQNAWNHLAVVRSGSNFNLYLNGTSISNFTSSTSIADNSLGITIGRDNVSGGRFLFKGNISNVRIVKGTAVYTANFTVTTSPLTNITNTSLLTCQSKSFIDSSTNNFAITRNGDVSIQTLNPF